MKIFTMPATCDVCGGDGVATPKVAAEQWKVGSEIRHQDPSICAENLRKKKQELDARETALKNGCTNNNSAA